MPAAKAAASLYEAPQQECSFLTQLSALLTKAFWLAAHRHLSLQRKCLAAGAAFFIIGLAVIAAGGGTSTAATCGVIFLALGGICIAVIYLHKPARIENASIVYWPFYFVPYEKFTLIFDMRGLLPPARFEQTSFKNSELDAAGRTLNTAVSLGLTSEGKLTEIKGLEDINRLLTKETKVDAIAPVLIRASERYVDGLFQLFDISPPRTPSDILNIVYDEDRCDLFTKKISEWDSYVKSSLSLLKLVKTQVAKTTKYFYDKISSEKTRFKSEFRARMDDVIKFREAMKAFFSQVILKLEDEIRPQLSSLEFEIASRRRDIHDDLQLMLANIRRERRMRERELSISRLSPIMSKAGELRRVTSEIERLDEEISSYEREIREKERRLKALKKKRARMIARGEDVSDMESDIRDLERELKDLRRRVEDRSRRKRSLESERSTIRSELRALESTLSSAEREIIASFDEHEKEVYKIFSERLRRLEEEWKARRNCLRSHVMLVEKDRDHLADDATKLHGLIREELVRILFPYKVVEMAMIQREKEAIEAIENMKETLNGQYRVREAYYIKRRLAEPTIFYLPMWFIEIVERGGERRLYAFPPQLIRVPEKRAISWVRDYVEFLCPLNESLNELATILISKPEVLNELRRYSIYTKDLRAIVEGVSEFVRRGFVSPHFYKELAKSLGVKV